jgi:hypothetical protein
VQKQKQQKEGKREGKGECVSAGVSAVVAERVARGQEARRQRLREQQMGFGTALPGSLPSLLQELLPLFHLHTPSKHQREQSSGGASASTSSSTSESPLLHPTFLASPSQVVLCDIGAGCGNVLSDVEDSGVLGNVEKESISRLWGVEMNVNFVR